MSEEIYSFNIHRNGVEKYVSMQDHTKSTCEAIFKLDDDFCLSNFDVLGPYGNNRALKLQMYLLT